MPGLIHPAIVIKVTMQCQFFPTQMAHIAMKLCDFRMLSSSFPKITSEQCIYMLPVCVWIRRNKHAWMAHTLTHDVGVSVSLRSKKKHTCKPSRFFWILKTLWQPCRRALVRRYIIWIHVSFQSQTLVKAAFQSQWLPMTRIWFGLPTRT